jgi:ABC-2 type transport system permease protein
MSLAGSLAKTPEQASNVSAIIALILGFLGGTFFPVAQSESGLLANLSLATPHAWFMRGLGDLAGGDVSAVLVPLGAMLVFGVVTGAIGLARMRRGLQV